MCSAALFNEPSGHHPKWYYCGGKMKTITESDSNHLSEAAATFCSAKKVVALTGAGISVESGIDDFRSPGGLWSQYPPDEYGTLDVFKRTPEKAWRLFHVINKGMVGKKPNQAHRVLADFEQKKMISGVVTQNIDNLHQVAGSSNVVEIHGDTRQLQCIFCETLYRRENIPLSENVLPHCSNCGNVLKPNVVLFGEQVRSLDDINLLLHRCDLLLVIGTSAQVYPAASLPQQVKMSSGKIFEFNITETDLTTGRTMDGTKSDYFFKGKASVMLTLLSTYSSKQS